MLEISLVVLKTRQVEALCTFYGTLGLTFIEEQHGKGPVHFSAKVGAAVFEIYPLPVDAPSDSSTRVGFSVDDAKVVVEALRKSGAQVVSEPKDGPWGLRAVLRDPDGRSVEVVQQAKS